MKKKERRLLLLGAASLVAFVLWTVLVCFVDVKAIGASGTSVGFATLNGYVHGMIGVNTTLYLITDWLGLVPIGTALGFAVLGLVQWIRRKGISRVDKDLLVLGAVYASTIGVYALFDTVVINYRPILIDGATEASYPSSTTMLVMCVMPTAMLQLHTRVKKRGLRYGILISISLFTAFMVTGRIISGVHWITDIIGGVLFSTAIVLIYYSVSGTVTDLSHK